jgi:hypothetical protein
MIQTLIRSAPAALSAVLFCAACPLLLAGPAATQPTTRDVRDAVDRDEEIRELLGEQPKNLLARLNGRMEESQARLADQSDPGAQTQEIQRRIINDIDDLINSLPKGKPPPNPKNPGDPADGPKGDIKGPQSAGGTQAAARSEKSAASAAPAKKLSPELEDRAQAFMQIAPRAVPSVIEGATEHIDPKYRNLTEAYYRAVAAAQNGDR